MDAPAGTQFATWSTPQCPFTISYSLRVMDDIRLAVIDAFFSLPRGGAEIGGILLGVREKKQISITDYAPLDCEHAYGPSFTLSERDHAKLTELLEIARRSAVGVVPVGWYHSHTRSEVFFSDADIAIHKQFFPEPWQIALVLKPHTFQPVRAGFFFREAGGVIHGEASYREFTVDPMGMPALAPASEDILPAPPVPVVAPPAMPEEQPEPVEIPAPDFLAVHAEAPRRGRWIVPVLLLAAAGAAAYWTRPIWMAPAPSAAASAPPAKPTAPAATVKPVEPAAKPVEPPAQLIPVEDPAIRKQRDDLAREAAKLRSDLKKQAERTKKLENRMDQMRLELLRQQRTRMQNMSPDPPPAPAKKP